MERRRVVVILVLVLASAVFWAGYEQFGSSLNLFAERYTVREFGGFEIPTTWFQSLNPTFLIAARAGLLDALDLARAPAPRAVGAGEVRVRLDPAGRSASP